MNDKHVAIGVIIIIIGTFIMGIIVENETDKHKSNQRIIALHNITDCIECHPSWEG